MNYKLTITEKGKTINCKGYVVRTPAEIILSESDLQLVLSQLKQLGIIQYSCETYVPTKKTNFSSKKNQPEAEPEKLSEKIVDDKPKSLLQKLAEGK